MSQEIIVAEGLFSKIAITFKDDTVNKLAFIKKKDNPLASVENDLKKVLDDFERRYFQITHPEQDVENPKERDDSTNQ